MTVGLLLTAGVGVGVMTLASMALMNAAAIRAHELRAPTPGFLYRGLAAEKLRISFRRMPTRLAVGLFLLLLWLLWTWWGASSDTQPVPSVDGRLSNADAQALSGATAYVVWLICFVLWLSHRLVAVVQDPFTDPA